MSRATLRVPTLREEGRARYPNGIIALDLRLVTLPNATAQGASCDASARVPPRQRAEIVRTTERNSSRSAADR